MPQVSSIFCADIFIRVTDLGCSPTQKLPRDFDATRKTLPGSVDLRSLGYNCYARRHTPPKSYLYDRMHVSLHAIAWHVLTHETVPFYLSRAGFQLERFYVCTCFPRRRSVVTDCPHSYLLLPLNVRVRSRPRFDDFPWKLLGQSGRLMPKTAKHARVRRPDARTPHGSKQLTRRYAFVVLSARIESLRHRLEMTGIGRGNEATWRSRIPASLTKSVPFIVEFCTK